VRNGVDRPRIDRPIRSDLSGPVLVAPDSFKGTIDAAAVAAALADGIRSQDLQATEMPVADGGEGTMAALLRALGGTTHERTVSDPLDRPIQATYALLADRQTAVIETAQASGLHHVEKHERDPVAASTRGTGELMVAALKNGARKLIVTVGGSATTDGGLGALAALDEAGLNHIDIDVICDVTTTYDQAAAIFGPQKGVIADHILELEHRLNETAAQLPRDPRGLPMTGCAGGLSGALYATFNAALKPGAAYILETLGFNKAASDARFVLTGEGRLDTQTAQGKIVGEIASRCQTLGIPCHAVVGRNELPPPGDLGLATITEARTIEELYKAGATLARSDNR